MKRLFIIFILFIFVGVPSFASNTLQQEDEELIRILVNSPTGRLTKHQLAIKQDYDLYKNGDKDTIYARLETLDSKYNPPYDMVDKINYKYILKTKELYMYLIDTPFTKSYTTSFYKGFENKLFKVPDREYQHLDKDLKLLIVAISVYK